MIKKINFINMEKKILVVTFFLIILSVSFVSAFGVVSPYWEGRPLRISPGDTAVVNLGLQNIGTDEDVTVKAVLKQGSEIASMEEQEYFIRAGTKDTVVPVTINIPLNIPIDTQYVVTVSFVTTNSDTGGVSLGTGIDTNFDVLISSVSKTEKKEEGKNLTLIIIILIIVLAIITLLYIFRKKIFRKNNLNKF